MMRRRPTSNRILAALVFVAALLSLGSRAGEAVFPPDNDQTYYLLGARNLASGRGFTENIVWHYLFRAESVTHPGNDYWLPLTSIILAPFVALDGSSYAATLIPMVVLGAVTTVLCYIFALRLFASSALAFACAIFYLCDPRVQYYATSTDSTILYAALVMGTLLLLDTCLRNFLEGRRCCRPVLVGGLAGLAGLTRSDALISLPVAVLGAVALAGALNKASVPKRVLVVASLSFLFVLAPWVVRNVIVFQRPWNPAASAVAFLDRYGDLYAFGESHDLSGFWSRLTADPWSVLASKAMAFVLTLNSFVCLLTVFMAPLVILGLGSQLRQRQSLALISTVYLLAIASTYGLLGDVVGGYHRSVVALLPLALSCVLWVMRSAWRRLGFSTEGGTARGRAQRLRRFTALAVAAAIGGVYIAPRLRPSRDFRGEKARATYARVQTTLSEYGYDAMDVVMSAQPWQLNYATGHPAVVLPSNGIEAGCGAARLYGAKALLLDGYALESPGYDEFRLLYRGELQDPRFQLVHAEEAWRIYRIQCDVDTCKVSDR